MAEFSLVYTIKQSSELSFASVPKRFLLFLTTVFVDTRLWKTKQPRKLFQNFRQSFVLLTDRIEIHQLQPASMT